MEILLPWNWPPQLVLWLCFVLVMALVGYGAIASTHIVKPSQRDKALEQARAHARSRFDHYQLHADKDRVSRYRYNKAKADLRVLENPGALAFQWYQLRHVGWLYGVPHWLVWANAVVWASLIVGCMFLFPTA